MSNLSDFLIGKGYGLKEVLTSSGTWNWTTAGKPKKIFVRMIGGSGGNAESGSGSDGGDGGDSVWDTGAVVATTTANGGTGASISSILNTTSQNRMPLSYSSGGGVTSGIRQPIINALNSHYGCPNGGLGNNRNGGGYGELKDFTYEPTANVVFTIGSGGTEGSTNLGDGIQGAIELYY